MKILYAIQGTGNGHLSRANDVIPALRSHAEVEILVSGIQADVSLPYKIKYRLKGLSFIFGKRGGVDIWQTIFRNDLLRLFREIIQLPVWDYDLIINDFEPVSAWAARWRNIPILSLSHQSALLSRAVPKPKTIDILGEIILNYYAPAKIKYGFHFKDFEENIFTPVIRKQVRRQAITNLGHYTVYLPSYSTEKILEFLSHFQNVQWQVFSKHSREAFIKNNIRVQPISANSFVESLASCAGVLCGAGFETPAEALFMGKKLMVMPMSGQFEQACNAAALEEMGIKLIKNLSKQSIPLINEWLINDERIQVNYPDITDSLIFKILEEYAFSEKNFHERITQPSIQSRFKF